ncbi:MAG TPA: tetratricopeptide repeat protein [Chitinophagaceae bacterium]|nr:tetratricopeptide repeat protein [Chitinophagaceae bacterium]
MRKHAILAVLICYCVFGYSQNADDAVKKTLQAEIDAIVAKNAENWKKTWVHSPDAQSVNISRFGYFTRKGWDSLAAGVDRDMKDPNNMNFTKIQLSNVSVHTSGNMAWAEYDAVITPKDMQPTIFPYSGETNFHLFDVLQKQGNDWKIVSQVLTNMSSFKNDEHTTEAEINRIGYRLMANKKMDQAIAVFKLNTELFPESFNTWDSLGEAYAAAGKKTEAIENYEKSLKLNPNNESGKTALSKLKQ